MLRFLPASGRLPYLLLCLALVLALSACGGGKPVPPRDGSMPPWMGTLRDMRTFPQDLLPFAHAAGADSPLLTAGEQASQDARFNRMFFKPWDMARTSISRKAASAIFGKARGYRGSVRWTQEEWDLMARNAAMKTFPNTADKAITIRQTDLREMPTHSPRFSEPTTNPRANPFDYFQYSLLPVGTPLFIAHVSRDRQWYYVESSVAAGWVDANDVALADATFRARYENGNYAAILRDNVPLPGSQNARGDIGTILPLAGTASQPGMVDLLVPIRKGSLADTARVTVPLSLAARKPLPMTPAAVAQLGNEMMGQRYGWGGMFGDRDCSALTRDLMAPFGIWLGRNSSSQGRAGIIIPLDGLSTREKERRLLQDGVPFLSLVWMRGHIMLYVGEYKGRPAIFHNLWGLRVINGDDDNDRFVVGRAVVTSIAPGQELRNLYRKSTFADRLRSLTILPPGRQ